MIAGPGSVALAVVGGRQRIGPVVRQPMEGQFGRSGGGWLKPGIVGALLQSWLAGGAGEGSCRNMPPK